MSAWMFSEKQINYLVTYAAKYDVGYYNYEESFRYSAEKDPQHFVNVLTKANCDSLIARYGKREGYVTYKYHPTKILEPLQILKNCNCFDYQACEVTEYEKTLAALVINNIRAAAIRNLPGYEEASWGDD